MGKKGKSTGAAAKARHKEERKVKQEAKAQRKAKKDAKKKGLAPDDEEDLDAILAEIRQKDADRMAVSIDDVPPPSPRAYFSFSSLEGTKSNDLVLFGGELFDGNVSECFNDLFRLNLEKLEWKKISSPNSPDPRNAHQAVAFRDTLYVFGGEFSKGYQFHHYKDLWKLDLNKNAWTRLDASGGPSPRSGHRMVVWRNYLIVFGGFYETSRGFKFYDDIYFFDMREEKWHLGVPERSGQRPSARGGFQFVCHASQNTVFIFGGYSKVAVSSSSEYGKTLDDCWALHLTLPQKAGACPIFTWEVVPKKGTVPRRRSGATSCVYKNRMILFGGVRDTETSNDVEGEFFNSLHAFDMDRRKWFELKSRSSNEKSQSSSRRRRDKCKRKVQSGTSSSVNLIDEEEDEEEDENDDGLNLDDGAFYVVIDGKITKIEIENEGDQQEVEPEISNQESYAASAEEAKPKAEAPNLDVEDDDVKEADQPNEAFTSEKSLDEGASPPAAEAQQEKNSNPAELNAPAPRIGAGLAMMGSKLFIYGGTSEVGKKQLTFDDLWCIDLNQMDKWTEVFPGTWRNFHWFENDEEEEEEIDDEEEEENDDDDQEEDADEDEDEDEDKLNGMTPAERSARISSLRSKLDLGDETKTPQAREPLRDFFKRTSELWMREVLIESDQEKMTGKELRTLAFKRARTRFDTLLPILEELDELEEDQKLSEERQASEKAKLREKLRAKARKRKAHMDKVAKKAKGKVEAAAAKATLSDEDKAEHED